MEKDILCKSKWKKKLALSDKISFKIKTVMKDIEGHYIMIKESIQQDITLVSIYIYTNIVVPKYIKRKLTDLMRQNDSNKIINRDSQHSIYIWIDHPNRKSIRNISLTWHIRTDGLNRYIQNIPSKISRMHFSRAYVTFSRINYMLGH